MAAIIVGGEKDGHLSGREILVQTFVGNLINVQDTAGVYDPLQYPMLFPIGTYGGISTQAMLTKIKCHVASIMHTSFRYIALYFQSITSKCRLHNKIIEPKFFLTNVENSSQ